MVRLDLLKTLSVNQKERNKELRKLFSKKIESKMSLDSAVRDHSYIMSQLKWGRVVLEKVDDIYGAN